MKHDQSVVTSYWNKVATSFDSIYTGEGKGPISRLLDQRLRRDIYQRFEWVMERSGDVRGKTICDVGCGSGRFAAEFARRGAKRVVAIDPAPDMLRLAKELLDREQVSDRCELIETDILDYSTTEEFDISIAIGLWDYFPDPSDRLRRIRAMTRGKFLSAWPRFWTWRMPVRKVRLQYVLGCPVYFFRQPQVFQYLEDTGFRVDSCDTVGKLYCVEATPI